MAFRFGILLGVRSSPTPRQLAAAIIGAVLCGVTIAWAVPQQSGEANRAHATSVQSAARPTPQQSSGTNAPSAARTGLNIVVLDPAHGGTDQGARGTEGISESDEIWQFATATKKALEAQGFQVILTREGNDNPSFDD